MGNSELEYIERTDDLPLKCRIVSIENSSPHWHHECEAFFVLRGAVSVHCEEAAHRLAAGDMFLFNARDIHSINQPEPDNLCLVLQFSPAVFTEVYKPNFRFELNTSSEHAVPCADVFRRDLAQIGLLLLEKPNGYPFFVKSCFYHFIGAMFRYLRYEVSQENECGKSPSDSRLEEFDAVKRYIKKRFAEEINIDQMCKDLAISRATFYRVLKESGTDSYKSLVNYYRVEHAKGLLRDTDTAIQYIATASGFDSGSSFYRIFKETTNLSPKQYREHPQKKEAPTGVQGYAGFSMPQAAELLREYGGRV